jgi:hypothetical protein
VRGEKVSTKGIEEYSVGVINVRQIEASDWRADYSRRLKEDLIRDRDMRLVTTEVL